MAVDLGALLGRDVRARRAGWGVPEGGEVRQGDLLDPPAWRDDGDPEWVRGTLEEVRFPGSEYVSPYTAYRVGGVPVDPATVRPAADA